MTNIPNYYNVIDIEEYRPDEWSDVSDWSDFVDTVPWPIKYVAVIQTDELPHIREVVKWVERNADENAMMMWIPGDWQFYRRIAFSEQGSELAIALKLKFGDTLETDPIQACDD